MKKYILFIVFLLSVVFSYADNFGSFGNNQVSIPPEQAFQVNATLESSNQILVKFNIMPGFYIYKDRLTFKSDVTNLFAESQIHLPLGFKINVFNGEKYAEEAVLNNKFDVVIPLISNVNNFKLTVNLQGCDGKTICYPPQQYHFVLSKPTDNNLKSMFDQIYSGTFNKQETTTNLFEIFLIFFIAGIAISLTPCMYPLYPIALSVISKNATKKSSVIKLTLSYMHGISLIYVLMGIIAAFSGKLLITVIQTPVFVLLSSGIILLLGLGMFDLFEIKLPNKLHNYVHNKSSNLSGGRYIPVFVLGILSSLLLGPCVTPPLIIAIGFIAHSGDVLSGILGLYAISLGMGVPILVLSTLGSKLLPKSGAWMDLIKHILGLVIIALAIYLSYPIIGLYNQYLSISVLCYITALAFLLIKHLRRSDLDLFIHKLIPILMIMIGLVFTFIGGKQEIITKDSQPSISISQLNQQITNSNKPVIIIVSAKWCSLCRELEATTFKDELVQEKFKNYTIIDLDITDGQKEYSEFLNQYNLYGPPAMIILNKDKVLQDKITGYIKAQDLIKRL